jgi:hypothetical protein
VREREDEAGEGVSISSPRACVEALCNRGPSNDARGGCVLMLRVSSAAPFLRSSSSAWVCPVLV